MRSLTCTADLQVEGWWLGAWLGARIPGVYSCWGRKDVLQGDFELSPLPITAPPHTRDQTPSLPCRGLHLSSRAWQKPWESSVSHGYSQLIEISPHLLATFALSSACSPLARWHVRGCSFPLQLPCTLVLGWRVGRRGLCCGEDAALCLSGKLEYGASRNRVGVAEAWSHGVATSPSACWVWGSRGPTVAAPAPVGCQSLGGPVDSLPSWSACLGIVHPGMLDNLNCSFYPCGTWPALP